MYCVACLVTPNAGRLVMFGESAGVRTLDLLIKSQ